MAIAYHTHTFSVPTADAADLLAGTEGGKVITPDVLGPVTAAGKALLSAANAGAQRAALDLEPGTDVQAYDADLAAIGALAKTDGNFIVGDGSTWVAESGSTARSSLGLTIGTDVQAYSANLELWSAESPTGYLTTASAASTYLTQAAAALAYQPVNVVLLAIAELAATSYGLDLLELADASAGRTALQLGAAATRAVATFGEYNSATASRALGNDSVWGDLAVLTDGATIAVDMNAGYDFGGASNAALALGGNRTLDAPTNVRNGKKGILWFTASGSTRTLTLNAAWVLASGVETGPYSITTSQTLGVAYVCRGTNVIVTSIVRVG